MARQVNESKMEIVNKIEYKGDPIPITGTTQSGKSTGIGFMAASGDVQDLMSMREAQGKGSTIETNIVVTDSEDISEDELIIKATMVDNHIANSGDDNVLLAKVLYPAVRKYAENHDKDFFNKMIRSGLLLEIKEPANDSLAYKIKDISEDELNDIVSAIGDFPIDKMVKILTETKAICEQRYKPKSRNKVERRIFKEKLSIDSEFLQYINKFWDCIIKILNKQSFSVINLLKEKGAYITENNTFIISLTIDDYNSDVAKILLDSEAESKEFLFENMSLVFRGNPSFYEEGLNKLLTVSEQDGKDVHCIRIIDSMGLFHSEGANLDEEAERVIDLIASNHSDKLLLIVNTHVSDTVKDGNAAVRTMLQKLKWEVGIYVINTHWDESIEQQAKLSTSSRRRSQSAGVVDWEQCYQSVKARQDEMVETYRDYLNVSNGKGKAYIAGVYDAAILINDESDKNKVLTNHGISYENALEHMVQDILKTIEKNGSKVRVREGFADQCVINPDSRSKDVKSLYRNMVVDCKGHKYWASSVRAVCRKWMMEGMNHDSDIAENEYGFMNIHSNFVIDMRNLAMGILKNPKTLELNVDEYIVGDSDKEQVKGDIIRYLTDGQAFGKEFAKLIGEKSYEDGFKKNTTFCYQYERLTDMLQYTQDNFFQTEKIILQDEESHMLLDNMREALHKCIENYVNAKCIEVY